MYAYKIETFFLFIEIYLYKKHSVYRMSVDKSKQNKVNKRLNMFARKIIHISRNTTQYGTLERFIAKKT